MAAVSSQIRKKHHGVIIVQLYRNQKFLAKAYENHSDKPSQKTPVPEIALTDTENDNVSGSMDSTHTGKQTICVYSNYGEIFAIIIIIFICVFIMHKRSTSTYKRNIDKKYTKIM